MLTSGTQEKLNQVLTSWCELLTGWSLDGSLATTAEHVLNTDGENAIEGADAVLQSYIGQWSLGDFESLPPIVLLSNDDISGASGAYAASTDTIYLNGDWLPTAKVEEIIAVLTEELGAFLDDQLNTVDTQGDEGALFSAALLGDELTDAERSTIQAESDTITISVDGHKIQAEANRLFPSVLELSSLDGSNGFTINGINYADNWGWSVSGAGDINSDGVDDLIIGPNNGDGESYVVFGSNTGFSASIELSSIDGSNGFQINGIGRSVGYSVSGAGDINGDGIDDLIIGAFLADPNGVLSAGESYVVFGNNTGFSASFDLSSLDGSDGFQINGIKYADLSGYSVGGAGDINGDGIDDLIIGAPYSSPNGESYVVFGSNTGFSASIELSSLDGSNGFQINGIGRLVGYSVSGAGDVNGDGIDDLIIGSPFSSPNGISRAGESYIVFGNTTGFSASFDLSSLDGSDGFQINGIKSGDLSGFSVGGAGDVNGDGIDDLIIGAYTANPNGVLSAGESYVVFGSNTGFSASFDLSSLDGSNGFRINGIGTYYLTGWSVRGAGDVNGDSIDDVIIGAPFGNLGGDSYLVFGSNTGFSASIELSSLDGSNGFRINGIDVADISGFSVGGAGDVNGDGIDDVIIGAPYADPNGFYDAGETYIVYGRGNTAVDTNAPIFTSGNTAPDLNENTGSKQVVYTASATDNLSAVTYSINQEAGDAVKFSIDPTSGSVTLLEDPDVEAKSSYSFNVIATDAAGNSAEQVVNLTVIDVNEAPTSIELLNAVTSIKENSDTSLPIKVADISIEDDALGENTVELIGADKDFFLIDSENKALLLKAGTTLDYESGKTSFDVGIKVFDPSLPDAPVSTSLNLVVEDVNEAPTSVELLNAVTSIKENSDTSLPIKVADISIEDDALGENTVELIGADKDFFLIDSENKALLLKAGTTLDYESGKTSFDVGIKVFDPSLPDAPVSTSLNLVVEDVYDPILGEHLSGKSVVNPKSKGVLPFAIFGGDQLDVREIELDKLEVGFGSFSQSPQFLEVEVDMVTNWAGIAKKNGGRGQQYEFVDINNDGQDDLLLKVSAQELFDGADVGSLDSVSSAALSRFELEDGSQYLISEVEASLTRFV